jgi:hypothetical protein
MLPDEHQGIGDDVESDGETAAGSAHHELESFQLIAAIVKHAHGSDCNGCTG